MSDEWEDEPISREHWIPEDLVAPAFAWGDRILPVAFFGSIFAGLFLTSTYSFLLFHSLAELFSIAVAFTVFILAWNLRVFLGNGFMLFIGVGMLFIGGVDLLHVLAYKGMNVFVGYDANLPTQLWIGARYMESFILFSALWWPSYRFNENVLFGGFLTVFALLVASIFWWDIFPICYVEGEGLTVFKVVSEYIIIFILAVALARLYFTRDPLHDHLFGYLAWAIVMTIFSEMAFTFYVGVYDLSNLFGHFFKVLSFYLIYKAVVVTGLAQPMSLLFRNVGRNVD